MVVDCDRRCVYFERGADFLGMAFTQLPPIRLFCAISAVYGVSNISIHYFVPTQRILGNTEVSCVYVGQPSGG